MDLEQLVQDVHDGNESGLKAFAILNDVLKTAKKCQDAIKDAALKEAELHGGKTFDADGYIFEKRNGGRRWDFKSVDEWQEAKAGLTAIETKLKSAWESKANGLATFSESTGEEMELPKVTYSTDSLVVKK
jgi:hypothetical protein